MALKYLIDTDICIYVRLRRPPEVLERFRSLAAGEAAISIITFGELTYGAEKSRDTDRALDTLGTLTEFLEVLPMPVEAGRVYGWIRTMLERKGEMIGGNDLWTAAHAVAERLTLVTNNEREFSRVEGLAVENWARP